jgi:tRNA(adenine34) deaminase
MLNTSVIGRLVGKRSHADGKFLVCRYQKDEKLCRLVPAVLYFPLNQLTADGCLLMAAMQNSTGYPTSNNNLDDIRWMRLALEQAHLAYELGEVPVGAVAVYQDRIIGEGFNRKERDLDPTAHAEMIALRQAAQNVSNWRLIGVTLYCTLEPCPMCAGAMIQGRLQRLVYGAPDNRFGADGTVLEVLGEPAFNHRVQVTSGVLADEAGELLQQFFRRLRGENL